MSIRITCPDCGKTYPIADELRGRKVRCRECAAPIVVEECIAVGEGLASVEVVDEADALQQEPRPRVRRPSRRERETGPRDRSVRKAGWGTRRVMLLVGVLAALAVGTAWAAWYDWFGLPFSPMDPQSVTITKAIHHLQSGDPSRARTAAERLKQLAPNDRRHEVAAALEIRLNAPHPFLDDEVAEALGVWGGEENVPALIKALDRPLGNRAALDALTHIEDPRAVEAIAGQLENFFNRHDAAKALRAIGPEAEEAVLRYLKHHEWQVRSEACDVLKAIGTAKSIAPLEKVVAENDFFVTRHAKEALLAIRRRE